MQPTLSDLISLARHAGGLLREGFGKRHAINHKSSTDLVTEMDHLSEDYLVGQIRASYPDHTIDTEESGLIAAQRPGGQAACWYIDPLDGTTNYAHNLPVFCVSLGFAEHSVVRLGVVYDPMRDECFSAELGKGAWLNGSPIRVSETQDLLHSLLVTGFPYDRGQSNLENFAHFTRLTQGVRRFGAAALDLCYVAAGRFEGSWEVTLKAWDIAAGALIVEEAGGRVTKLNGDTDLLVPPVSVLAGNPAVHRLMLAEFQNGIKLE